MNVDMARQLELVMLTRTLNIIKQTPGFPLAHFYSELNKHLEKTADLSLSSFWNESESLVKIFPLDTSSKDSDDGPSQPVLADVPELHYLQQPSHVECKHDPLLVVRTLFDTAVAALPASLSFLKSHSTVDDEALTPFIVSCFLLGMKSGRASLLIHTAFLSMLFRNEQSFNVPVKLLHEHWLKVLAVAVRERDTIKNMEKNSQNAKKFSHSQSFERSIVLSCGKADHGKLGLGDIFLHRQLPTEIESLSSCKICKLASMSTFSMALSSNGDVYLWGTGGALSLTLSPSLNLSMIPQKLEALPSRTYVADIGCGLGHALFLSREGIVYSWGSGSNGRLGLGETVDRSSATIVTTLLHEKVSAVCCGASHSMCLTESFRVYSWGKNSAGQCGLGHCDDAHVPSQVKRFDSMHITQLAAGWEHSFAITSEGKLYSWGCGYRDTRRGSVSPVLGQGHSEPRNSPDLATLPDDSVICKVRSGWDHSLAICTKGILYSWGAGQHGKLGHGNEDSLSIPCIITALEGVFVRDASAGCEHSVCISAEGDIFVWGLAEGGRLGLPTVTAVLIPQKISILQEMHLNAQGVYCGDKFTMFLASPSESTEGSINLESRSPTTMLATMQNRISAILSTSSIPPPVFDDKNLSCGIEQIGLSIAETFMEQGHFLESIDKSLIASKDPRFCTTMLMRMLTVTSLARTSISSMSCPLSPDVLSKALQLCEGDLEYGVECCEDSFASLSLLLQHLWTVLSIPITLLTNFADALNQERNVTADDHAALQTSLAHFNWTCELVLFTMSVLTSHSLALSVAHGSDSESNYVFFNKSGSVDQDNDNDCADSASYSTHGDQDEGQSQAASDKVLEADVDQQQHLSPAHSLESLHQVDGDSLGKNDEEGDDEADTALGDDDVDDYYYDEDDEDEMETFELQQALLISTLSDVQTPSLSYRVSPRNRSTDLDIERAIAGAAGRRDGKSLTALRDTLNALASQIVALLQRVLLLPPSQQQTFVALKSFASDENGSQKEKVEKFKSTLSFSPISTLALVWESVQQCTSAGFDTFYNDGERITVMLQLIRSPSSFLYVAPGVWRGLTIMNTRQSNVTFLSRLFDEKIFFVSDDDVADDDIEGESVGNTARELKRETLNIDDLVVLSEFLLKLFKDHHQSKCSNFKNCSLESIQNVNLQVLHALSNLLMHLWKTVWNWLISLENFGELTTEIHLPWGEKVSLVLHSLCESAVLDLQLFLADNTHKVSIAKLVVEELFKTSDVSYSVSELCSLLPTAVALASQISSKFSLSEIREFPASLNWIVTRLSPFLVQSVHVLSRPPTNWYPLHPIKYASAISFGSLWMAPTLPVKVLASYCSNNKVPTWLGCLNIMKFLPIENVTSTLPELALITDDQIQGHWRALAALSIFEKEKRLSLPSCLQVAATILVNETTEQNRDRSRVITIIFEAILRICARSFVIDFSVCSDLTVAISLDALLIAVGLLTVFPEADDAIDVDEWRKVTELLSHLQIINSEQTTQSWISIRDCLQVLLLRTPETLAKAEQNILQYVCSRVQFIEQRMKAFVPDPLECLNRTQVHSWLLEDAKPLKQDQQGLDFLMSIADLAVNLMLDKRLQTLFCWKESIRRARSISALLFLNMCPFCGATSTLRDNVLLPLSRLLSMRDFNVMGIVDQQDSLSDPHSYAALNDPTQPCAIFMIMNKIDENIRTLNVCTRTLFSPTDQDPEALQKSTGRYITMTSQEKKKFIEAFDVDLTVYKFVLILLSDQGHPSPSLQVDMALRRIDMWCRLFNSIVEVLQQETTDKVQERIDLLAFFESALLVCMSTDLDAYSYLATRVLPSSSVMFLDCHSKCLQSVLQCLQALVLQLTSESCAMQSIVWNCVTTGSQYALSRSLSLFSESPRVHVDLFSASGDFSLSFWVQLTNISRNAESGPLRMHILSRSIESGDLQSLKLLTQRPEDIDCYTLYVELVSEWIDNRNCFYLDVYIITNLFEKDGRRLIRRCHLRSSELSNSNWNHIVLSISQYGKPAVPKKAEPQRRFNLFDDYEPEDVNEDGDNAANPTQDKESKFADETKLWISVNDNPQECVCDGGKWPLHQHLLVGTLPSCLGTAHGVDLSDSRKTDIEKAHLRVLIRDVLWVPFFHTSALPEASISSQTPIGLLAQGMEFTQSCTSLISQLLGSLIRLISSFPQIPTHVSVNMYVQIHKLMPEMLILGNLSVQHSTLKLLESLMSLNLDQHMLVVDGTNLDSSLGEYSDKIVSPLAVSLAGGARNVAVRARASQALIHTLRLLVEMLASLIDCRLVAKVDLTASNKDSPAPALDLAYFWFHRLSLARGNAEAALNSQRWVMHLRIDESGFFNDIVKYFATLLQNSFQYSELATAKLKPASLWLDKLSNTSSLLFSSIEGIPIIQETCVSILQIIFSCTRGGALPGVHSQSICSIAPRRHCLHATGAERSESVLTHMTESIAFCEQAGAGGSLHVWLYHGTGHAEGVLPFHVSQQWFLLPRSPNVQKDYLLPSSELVDCNDEYSPLFSNLPEIAEILPSFDKIQLGLKQALMLAKKGESIRKKRVRGKMLNSSTQGMGSVPTDIENDSLISLLQGMASLRSALVQVSFRAVQDNSIESDQMKDFCTAAIFSKLLAFSCKDASDEASAVFENCSFKGVQLDVLRNLLREGDLAFLEKLCIRHWRGFRNYHVLESPAWFPALHDEELTLLAPLAGEVSIVGNRIRASSHFPSVRMTNVALDQRSGRWFYECILLTDGLMQIGWADSLFRCDPVCGQGVGDHAHSWAFDGLRAKKWNVSCEPFGKRWKAGDVFGTLLDMDLLEIRFYLNGEDLGSAFEDLPSSDMFPAFSLNMRQALRVNLGSERFLFPPMDGFAFRPVIDALSLTNNTLLGSSIGSSSKNKLGDNVVANWNKQHEENGLLMDQAGLFDADDRLLSQEHPSPDDSRSEDRGRREEQDALRFLASLREREREIAAQMTADNENSDIQRSERRRVNEVDSDEEEKQVEELRYMLSTRWQDDLEERMRMEVDDREDFDGDEEEDNNSDERDSDGDHDSERDRDDDESERDREDDSPMDDLRRQALIESLLGMGFPTEWALRAAEHSSSVSESAAIAWIIERMENEQQLEGTADLRHEEADDIDSNRVEYFLQRDRQQLSSREQETRDVERIMNTPLSARALTRRMDSNPGLSNADAINNAATSLFPAEAQALLASPSPTRGEGFAVHANRRAIPTGLSMSLFSDEQKASANSKISSIKSARDGKSSSGNSSNKNQEKEYLPQELVDFDGEGDNETLELAFCPGPAWLEVITECSMLPGQGLPGERQREREKERQEVLSQVSELDTLDLVPIVAACEFALCVHFARATLLRLLPYLCRDKSPLSLSPNDLTLSGTTDFVSFLSLSFRHLLQSRPLNERLFPTLSLYPARVMTLSVSAADLMCEGHANHVERVPFINPFASELFIEFSNLLRRLEMKVFPRLQLVVHAEECGTTSIAEMEAFLKRLMDFVANDQLMLSTTVKLTENSSATADVSFSWPSVLTSLLSFSVQTISKSCGSRYDGIDFVCLSLAADKSLSVDQEILSTSPPLLFAHWALTVCINALIPLLQTELLQLSPKMIEGESSPVAKYSMSLVHKENPVHKLLSAQTFLSLLRSTNSQNDSVRFVTHDLCSRVLQLRALVTQCLSIVFSWPRFECSAEELVQIREFVSNTTRYFLLSATREQRLMLSMSHRFKTEPMIHTRYTRALCTLLSQWRMLLDSNKRLILAIKDHSRITADDPSLEITSADHERSLRQGNVQEYVANSLGPAKALVRSHIRISHVTSSSITATWSLPPSVVVAADESLSFYITSCDTDLSELALCVPDINRDGVRRVDDLEPDVLYRLSIRKDKDSDRDDDETETPELCSVMVSTNPEPGFSFQADNISQNIQILPSSPLTLRNAASKKWSTARASIRLSRGVHRWDVRIDKCVSKNVFLGVCSADAPLDNYVGCDENGWAFLANKAIWHNKVKTKSYGELFRTGDTVSVLVDLELGTLSFCLNDRPLGVAVEGLSGPVYPAFSLYNEDDQVTITQAKSLTDQPSLPFALSADIMLFRQRSLKEMTQLLYVSHETSTNSRLDSSYSTFSSVLPIELARRWQLWKENVVLHTVEDMGSISTIQVCPHAVRAFAVAISPPLTPSLQLQSLVMIDQRMYRVVGVSTCQQCLWLRDRETHVLLSLSLESVLSHRESGLLEVMSAALSEYDDKDRQGENVFLPSDVDEIPQETAVNESSWTRLDTSIWEVLCGNMRTWKRSHDECLSEWLEELAKHRKTNVFSLSVRTVVRALKSLRVGNSVTSNSNLERNRTRSAASLWELLSSHNDEDILSRSLLILGWNDLFRAIHRILLPSTRSIGDNAYQLFALRSCIFASVKKELLIRTVRCNLQSQIDFAVQLQEHFSALRLENEFASTAKPEVRTHDRKHIEPVFGITNPSVSVVSTPIHGLLSSSTPTPHFFGSASPDLSLPFASVEGAVDMNPKSNSKHSSDVALEPKQEINSQRSTPSEESKDRPTTQQIIFFYKPVQSSSQHCPLILELQREEDVRLQLLWGSHVNGSLDVLLSNKAWNLYARLQCSFVGQLTRRVEQLFSSTQSEVSRLRLLSETAASSSKSSSVNHLNKWYRSRESTMSLVEHALRCTPAVGFSAQSPSNLKTPAIIIRNMAFIPSHSDAHSSLTTEEAKLELQLLRGEARRRLFWNDSSRLFDWLEIAANATDEISDWTVFAVFVEEAMAQIQEFVDSLFVITNSHSDSKTLSKTLHRPFEASEIALMLQIMHSTGLLVAFAWNSGIIPRLSFPDAVYHVLALSDRTISASGATDPDLLKSLVLSLRFGIASVFPESVLDLWTPLEFHQMLGGPCCTLSLGRLYAEAVYDDSLSRFDSHIQFFWIGVYELSTADRESLTNALLRSSAQHKAAEMGAAEPLTTKLRIMKPTAAAQLQADTTDITLFPDLNGISLPRYSSLKILYAQLRYLIKSLKH